MASEKNASGDKYAVKVEGGYDSMAAAPSPAFAGDFIVYEKDENGNVREKWREPFHNIVVDQGRALILNKVFANGFANHTNHFLFLHSATTAAGVSTNTWGNISASQIGGYGANLPRLQFTTAATDSTAAVNSMTTSTSFAWTTSTYTVHGAGVLFFTNTSMATNFATSDGRLYAYGSFATSQQVQNGNSMTVSLTVSFNTI